VEMSGRDPLAILGAICRAARAGVIIKGGLFIVVRNNSRRGCCRVQRLQIRADSGMMSACCSWRERSSE
jgi:hypothetical protein